MDTKSLADLFRNYGAGDGWEPSEREEIILMGIAFMIDGKRGTFPEDNELNQSEKEELDQIKRIIIRTAKKLEQEFKT